MNLIVLYGIGRNNKISEKYFENFINYFHNNKLEVMVHYYFLEIGRIENPRSNEFRKLPKIENNPFNSNKLFRFKKKEIDISYFKDKLKSVHDIYNDNYKSYENLLYQLSLLKKVNENTDFTKFKTVCFIRDDILLSGKINIKSLISFSSTYSIISAWSWHNGYNDRFFLTNSEGAKVFSNRIMDLEKFINRNKILQGEQLLKFSLNLRKIKLLILNLRTVRIRSNGDLIKDNHLVWSLFYTKNFFELITLIFKSYLIIKLK